MRIESDEDLDSINDRYATLRLIDWFDASRVGLAKVLVVGAGAIGNEVLKNLALLGVGNIYIFDRDTIEMSNLSRSILYRETDCGLPKASTAARALKEVNPSVNVFWYHGDIESGLGEGFVRRMDAVIGCLDSVEARFALNRICWRAGRPWVDAGIGALNGQVRVFQPPDGPCYECGFEDEDYKQLKIAKSCNAVASAQKKQGRIPTTPTIASLVAAVQVQEFLKLLDPDRWKGRSLAGRQFAFNGTVGEAEVFGLPSREGCPAHDEEIGADEIVACPDMTAQHTAGELLAKARELIDPAAHLYLNSEIAIERQCPQCGSRVALLRAMHQLVREGLTCANCGRPGVYESDITSTTHIIGSETPPEVLNMKLSEIGVPTFGFVEVRNQVGESRYLEIAGDPAWAMEPGKYFAQSGANA